MTDLYSRQLLKFKRPQERRKIFFVTIPGMILKIKVSSLQRTFKTRCTIFLRHFIKP